MSEPIRHALVGATVCVRACGDKPAFQGRVKEAWMYKVRGKPTITYFHVEDPTDGSLWNRSLRDLTHANDNNKDHTNAA